MFDNENEKTNNENENAENRTQTSAASDSGKGTNANEVIDAPYVESNDGSLSDDTFSPDTQNSDKPQPSDDNLPDYDGEQDQEVLNLGYVNKDSEGTPTYYKKAKRKPNIFVACLLSVVATAILIVGGMYAYENVFDYVKTHQGAGNTTAQQSNTSSKASTLEQLAKKDGSEMSIVDIANKVGPAVCGITVSQQIQSFFGTQLAEGSGSGIIISEDGYIVTNQHVIEDADTVKVILSTGQEYEGTVVGQDVSTDLAVVKIDETGLPVAELGYSSELEVGELAIAIGNPLGQEFAGSLTVGVISALNRTVSLEDRTYTLIQTDAAINSGNSGGALVNSLGQVVGINSLKVSSAEGLGFAIPIDIAKPIIEELITNGSVTGRPVIGVSLREIDEGTSEQYNVPQGLYVVYVTEFGAAEKAGIRQADVIIEADGQKVSTVAELNAIKNQKKAGDKLTLKIKRAKDNYYDSDWTEKTIDLILGEESSGQ